MGDTQVARSNTLGLVFTTKNGTPLEPRNINQAFETLCRRASVRSIRLHDLRQSCATLLFAMGVEAATVQRVLRNSSISVTTRTYVDVIEQVQRSAIAGMDSLLSPAKWKKSAMAIVVKIVVKTVVKVPTAAPSQQWKPPLT